MSGEAEPRRSIRATKGQHTKAFDEQQIEAPKKRGRKKKQEQEEPEEEIIRCVCGATEQDGDSEEPWIACDTCGAWQHNVCMGMSVFTEDLPKHYYCEQCGPQDHKELLEAIAKGEKPWEERRRLYEEEQSEKKKKKKKPGRGGKRVSDPTEELAQATATKTEESPAPEALKKEKEKKDVTPKAGIGKRKTREEVNEKEVKGPVKKQKKTSETDVATVDYVPPPDLPAKIAELSSERQGGASVLLKPLLNAIESALKKSEYVLPKNTTAQAKAERLALEIERAVHDTHPNFGQYGQQARSIGFNLKNNPDLCKRLLKLTLAPTTLAVMTTDQMATKELQQETAEMKARAEKQAILITDDGPRVRRTHKGEEIVENESFVDQEEAPSIIRRPSVRDGTLNPRSDAPHPAEGHGEFDGRNALHIDTQGSQYSPKNPNFDINKVFSSVKSPTGGHVRRPSGIITQPSGPGVDPDVDRLLQDETESPPYSPTDESDPDVVWRGNLTMSSIADFQATAKWIGGSNAQTTIGVPWSTLIPKRLTVAGRIDEQKAIEYLCGLRFSDPTDIVVTALMPALEADKPQFQSLIDYFVSKKRYGVVGDKGAYNVRDTYLVPVPPGEGNFPEFMLNFSDNMIPHKRSEPMLLIVFVWRREPGAPKTQAVPSQSPVVKTPTPVSGVFPQRHPSISGPAFSPASPQGPFPQPGFSPSTNNSQLPSHTGQVQRAPSTPGMPSAFPPARPSDADREQLQQQGQAMAEEILGQLINSPTVQFILPQAFQMTRKEWVVIKGIFERDSRARQDLKYLSQLLEKEGSEEAGSGKAANPPPPPVAHQTISPSA